MRLLLDSHVLLWWLADDARLPDAVREAVADGDNDVAVSAATTWEVSIKEALGRLVLPRHHGDPFDRKLIAQARSRSSRIVTVDRAFSAYDVALFPG